jgi:CheY-like chemotaxis protein
VRVHTDGAISLISADPERLQQVIWNLLSNAIKFTPEGGRVEVTTRRIGDDCEIRVTDTGQGIPQDFLPHVFERFRQADASTTRAHGGLGLGLAIVRHLIEMHGGTVSAESAGIGRGSTFIARLPIRASRRKASAGRFRAYERPVTEPLKDFKHLKGLQILVVDDDLDTGEALSAALTQHGAKAFACASAADALLHVERFHPDILVADIGMPGEDGYSLIRKIRARPAAEGGSTPGIALTAYAGDANRRRALEAGFQQHMVKPVEPDELISAICHLASKGKEPA